MVNIALAIQFRAEGQRVGKIAWAVWETSGKTRRRTVISGIRIC